MVREFSAGGVVIRKMATGWSIAAIEPERETPSSRPLKKAHAKIVLALPKGLVDPGEKPEVTAIREVQEETGIVAVPLAKLADIKYFYIRSWANNERVFKVVSFYLLRYKSGRIGEISPDMRIEVRSAQWVPLEEAHTKLAYRGEREVVQKAQAYLQTHPEI
jgi:8-oxo-dGTP pyrophosphatase MutT (NUDIX family)